MVHHVFGLHVEVLRQTTYKLTGSISPCSPGAFDAREGLPGR